MKKILILFIVIGFVGNAQMFKIDQYNGFETGPNLGPELVINGTFAADTDWTKNNGSTISGGLGNLTGAGPLAVTGSNASLWQDLNLVSPSTKTFRVTYDARQITGSGTLEIGRFFVAWSTQAVTGTMTTYTFDVVNPTDDRFGFAGTVSGNIFEIDNVSVKQVLP